MPSLSWAWRTFLALVVLPCMAQAAATPEGRWRTLDDRTGAPRAVIRIEVQGAELRGYVERILLRPDEGPDPLCTHCPGALKDRRVVGMDVLSGLRRDDDRWRGGTILDPHTGEVYRSELWIEAPGLLRVRGYSGLFHRTQTWRRAGSAADPGSPLGIWEAVDERYGPTPTVEVREEDGRLFGRVVKVHVRPDEGPDPICSRCAGSRNGQKVIGMNILWGHRREGDRWVAGTILDPENGKEYSSTVWLEGRDVLRVRGHWGPFHRTQTWRRVGADELAPDPASVPINGGDGR